MVETSPPKLLLAVSLALLVILGPLTIDFNLPALPAMRREFGVPDAAIQATLTGATLGFGVGQLLVGPVSDSLGRRTLLIASVAAHILASVAAAAAPGVTALTALRVLQGMSCTAAGVVVVAVVRDLYQGRELVRMLANVGLITSVAPLVVPFAGGQLLDVLSWRATFLVVAAYGVLGLVAVLLIVPETLAPTARLPLAPAAVVRRYVAVLREPAFAPTAIVNAARWSAAFSYLGAAPFLLQDRQGLTPGQASWVFLGTAVLAVAVSQTTSRLVLHRVAAERLLVVSGAGLVLAAVVLAAAGTFGALLVALALVAVSSAVGGPALQLLLVRDSPGRVGTVVSLYGFLGFAVAGLVSPLVGALGATDPRSLAVVLGGCALGVAVPSTVLARRAGRCRSVEA